jgi:hypothetical protein
VVPKPADKAQADAAGGGGQSAGGRLGQQDVAPRDQVEAGDAAGDVPLEQPLQQQQHRQPPVGGHRARRRLVRLDLLRYLKSAPPPPPARGR